MNPRTVAPELLDELPAADPRAVGSRADLVRLNAIMGHAAILARLWIRSRAAGGHAVEFGAGDGTLCHRLLQRLPASARPARLTLVDRQRLVSESTRAGLEKLGVRVDVHTADIFEWLRRAEPFDLGLANLFLHHFHGPALRDLLAGIAGAGRVFLAVEPGRCVVSRLASRMLALIGCNAVTRHDAAVSVRAGFAGRELSGHWPASDAWNLAEHRAGMFSHAFLAVKRPG